MTEVLSSVFLLFTKTYQTDPKTEPWILWYCYTPMFIFDRKEQCGDNDGETGRLEECSDWSESQLLLCHSSWISDKLPIPNEINKMDFNE